MMSSNDYLLLIIVIVILVFIFMNGYNCANKHSSSSEGYLSLGSLGPYRSPYERSNMLEFNPDCVGYVEKPCERQDGQMGICQRFGMCAKYPMNDFGSACCNTQSSSCGSC